MPLSYTFRNIDATEGLKTHAEEKLKKLEKYLIKPEKIHVICTIDHIDHCAEITISEDGHHFVGHEKSTDMYASIDSAVEKLARQLKRHKEMVKDKKHNRPMRDLV